MTDNIKIAAEQKQVIDALQTLIEALQQTPIEEFEQVHKDIMIYGLSASVAALEQHQEELVA